MTRNVARAFRARVKTPPPPPQSFVIQLVPPSITRAAPRFAIERRSRTAFISGRKSSNHVAACDQDDHGDVEAGEILFVLEVTVDGQEDIELALG